MTGLLIRRPAAPRPQCCCHEAPRVEPPGRLYPLPFLAIPSPTPFHPFPPLSTPAAGRRRGDRPAHALPAAVHGDRGRRRLPDRHPSRPRRRHHHAARRPPSSPTPTHPMVNGAEGTALLGEEVGGWRRFPVPLTPSHLHPVTEGSGLQCEQVSGPSPLTSQGWVMDFRFSTRSGQGRGPGEGRGLRWM